MSERFTPETIEKPANNVDGKKVGSSANNTESKETEGIRETSQYYEMDKICQNSDCVNKDKGGKFTVKILKNKIGGIQAAKAYFDTITECGFCQNRIDAEKLEKIKNQTEEQMTRPSK